MKKLRFVLFGNEYQARKSMATQKVLSCLEERKATVLIDKPFFNFLSQTEHLPLPGVKVFENDDFDADYAISIGGDGTFLRAAVRAGMKHVPIIGINMGRLGFLADVMPGEAEAAIAAICEGRCITEERAVIQLETKGKPLQGIPYALNDIAVLKRDNASMISIRTEVNGDYLITYQSDGLVVATPTGSTAYSLSNGGPIMMPQTRNLCLTPVAPHSLNIRPMVISDDCEITLQVGSRSHNFLVAIDGRSETLTEGTHLVIRKAPFSIRVLKWHGERFISTLRDKMLWGRDQRSLSPSLPNWGGGKPHPGPPQLERESE